MMIFVDITDISTISNLMGAVCGGHVHDEPQLPRGVVDVLPLELSAFRLQNRRNVKFK